jgi:rare lipoprotein A
MRYAIRNIAALAVVAALASCSSFSGSNDREVVESPSSRPVSVGATDETVKLGAPYTVGSITYTPADIAQYDEVGYASYYGADRAGQPTASGEIFNPASASAAHKTLPMPSYVEVTALDTGRTVLVRINDRGPLANDRLIDLSEGAARQLGIGPRGVAGVRVRRVNPPEQEKAVLRQGMTAAERIETPEPLLKVLRDKLSKQPRPALAVQKPVAVASKPGRAEMPPTSQDGRFIREGGKAATSVAQPSPPRPAARGDYVAQIGAFSSKSRAEALARKLGASVAASADGRLYRVRLGPFANEAEAAAAARRKGYSQARVYRD